MDSKQHQCIFQAYESGDGRIQVEMETKCPNCNNLVTAVWEPKKE